MTTQDRRTRRDHSAMVRLRGQVYPTREAVLAAGYPDAEYGQWVSPNGSDMAVGGTIGWLPLVPAVDLDFMDGTIGR